MRLQGEKIYLAVLERKDCKKLWNDFEYDLENPTEEFNIGHSDEKADGWFDEIQQLQGKQNVRLGIFLKDGTVIGDVALQNIDQKNRSCSVGIGIAKIENRANGYGREAVQLMIDYGFRYLGMERITANTLEMNIGAQKVIERCGLTLEGRERKAIYLNGNKYDRLCYAILKEEYFNERER
ncbi:MAG: GNAT family N-acetyltransferase [Lachnospiraceae bacterium]|nr:GNAT family N-acetyltransferase [Lachnospiraceae bacterium]